MARISINPRLVVDSLFFSYLIEITTFKQQTANEQLLSAAFDAVFHSRLAKISRGS
jgi:hypothetical protein